MSELMTQQLAPVWDVYPPSSGIGWRERNPARALSVQDDHRKTQKNSQTLMGVHGGVNEIQENEV